MKVIVVGGVAGGASAAARLRRNSEQAEIILLEKGDYISFANCGLPYHIGGIIPEEDSLLLQTPAAMARRFNIDVRVRHECLTVDTASKSVKIKNRLTDAVYVESYDKLLLSPGAEPIAPVMPGAGQNKVFTLRNIPDMQAVKQYVQRVRPENCAVIGGGFIGVEMAENLHAAGIKVSIVEASDHLIGPLDEDMAHDLHNYLRKNGVAVFLNSYASEMTADSVILQDGARVPANMVILSIGVRPATAFLEDSGIVLGQKGEIIVNEYMETSCRDVYAVGDAVAASHIVSGKNAVTPLASLANRQGVAAADNICGIAHKYAGSQGTAIAKAFDMTVAVTGLNEAALKARGILYRKSITYSPSNAAYYPGGQMMAIKLLFGDLNGILLGAQIVGGKGVDKRIDVIAAAMRAKATATDLQDLELAYAPPFASAKDPVNMAGYVAGNILSGKSEAIYTEDMDNFRGALLDVRTPGEFAKGSIPGAANIQLDELRDRLSELDLTKPLCVFCQIGLRGYVAERILKQRGFKVKNLIGGYRLYAARRMDTLSSRSTP